MRGASDRNEGLISNKRFRSMRSKGSSRDGGRIIKSRLQNPNYSQIPNPIFPPPKYCDRGRMSSFHPAEPRNRSFGGGKASDRDRLRILPSSSQTRFAPPRFPPPPNAIEKASIIPDPYEAGYYELRFCESFFLIIFYILSRFFLSRVV